MNGGTPFTLIFSGKTTGAADQDFGGNNVNYETLSGLNIPTGTTSIWFGFIKSTQTYGPGYDIYHGVALSEIQAFETAPQTSATPEPSTVQLAFVGLAALLVGIWRPSRKMA